MFIVKCEIFWLIFLNLMIFLTCFNPVSLGIIRHRKSRTYHNRLLKRNNLLEYEWRLSGLESESQFIGDTLKSKETIERAIKSTEFPILEDEATARIKMKSEKKQDADYHPEDKKDGENWKKKLPQDIVTKFLRIVETQHLLGENCTAGTDLNLGEGVVDRYAQERFRVEADVAVNRANMLTRLWKYADPSVLNSEYLLHASVIGMVEFDDNIFAAGNCYDEFQYKDYWLFCPYAFRLPDGPILAKNLAIEYKYMTNSSEWFFIARKSAERIIKNHEQFRKGYNAFTYNDTAHKTWVPDEILSVKYEDGKWSKPYYDCGGGNIWMLTYTVPFFGYKNNSYYFMGTSGIDIDLRRVDIDQCPLPPGNVALNIFAGSDKCKKETTMCEPISGLGFRRGSYKCLCKKGYYHPNTKSENRYYNGTVVEDEYEKFTMGEENQYIKRGMFECLPCAEGCESCIDKRPCIVSLNWIMRTIILVFSCIIILFLPVIAFFTWKYGNVKVVRAASPVLLRFIILGSFFIYCTPIVTYPTPNLGTCTLRVWLREIGFSLTYGALMLKTWRISIIFHVRSAKPIRITDLDLLKRLGMIVGVFCLFLVIRTLVAPPFVITGRTADDLKAYLCRTDWWDHSFTSLEVLFLIWGIRLCIVVRKAPSEFNESRFISMAIYNEFLLTVFLNVSMLFLQKPANPDLLYIIFFCHTQLTVTLLLCLIFGSKAYIVFRNQGKLDETSSTISRPQTTTFLVKPKSVCSQQNPSTQSSNVIRQDAIQSGNMEIQEEFKHLCLQLNLLKERNLKLGNKALANKIIAMQDAAKEDFQQASSQSESSAAERMSKEVSGKRENSVNENKVFDIEVDTEKSSALEPTGKDRGNMNSHCLTCGGKVKKINCDNAKHSNQKEHNHYATSDDNGQQSKDEMEKSGSRLSPTSERRLRSGHARTHSIIINLDDNNRFTDEVTV